MALTKINDFYSFDFSEDYIMDGKLRKGLSYESLMTYLYKEKAGPPSVTFQITDACNLACSYCYQINKGKHKMSLEVAKKFIDILLDNNEMTKTYMDTDKTSSVIFDFIGGEPLLEIELIDQIIDYFEEQVILKDHPWQYHPRYSFSSNGTLYFDEKVQKFLQKRKNRCYLSISIDGNKELHDSCRKFPDGTGSYDIAAAAVNHYRLIYNRDMGSKLTIAPENIKYLSKAVINMIENHYHNINLNCIFEKGWKDEHATILYYQLKEVANYLIANNLTEYVRLSMFNENQFSPLPIEDSQNWCGGNGRMIAVDWKGDIYPCLRYMESSLGNGVPPIIIGNIYEGLLPNASCKTCVEALKAVNRLTQSTEECIYCEVAAGCSWCQACNYQESGGDFNHRATNICKMHQATSLANVYYWNLIAIDKKRKEVFKRYLIDEKALTIIPKEELILLNSLELAKR